MNNKILTPCLGMLVLCSTPAASTPTRPLIDWSGVYVGGFLGGASGPQINNTEPLRVDNQTYWFRPFHNSYRYPTGSSFIGGGNIGYNWNIGNTPYLLSLEGEYGYIHQPGNDRDPNQIPYATLPGNNKYNNTSLNSTTIGSGYGLIGGRIGYASDRALFYVKSGAVITKIVSQYQSTKTDSTSSTGVAYLNMYGAHNITGYGVGGGIEYALPFKGFSNVSVRIEYLYLGLGQTESEYGHCSCNFLWLTEQVIGDIHTAKFGAHYKFT